MILVIQHMFRVHTAMNTAYLYSFHDHQTQVVAIDHFLCTEIQFQIA